MPVFMKLLPILRPNLAVLAIWWEKSRDDGHHFSEDPDANNPVDDLKKEEEYDGE